MLKLAQFIKEVKKYANDPNISDEAFLNAFLSSFIIAGDVTDRNGDELHFDKSRTSLLLNQKIDINQNIRKALSRIGIREATENGMLDFVEDYLNPTTLDFLYAHLIKLIHEDESIPDAEREELIVKANGDIAILLADLQIMAFSEDNRIKPQHNIIWKRGSNSVEVITGDLFQFGFNNRKKKKNIVTIPVNTAFDTHVTRKFEENLIPIVSENTIHGQWISRIEQSGTDIKLLDVRISESLKRFGYKPLHSVDNNAGNPRQFEIGACAAIEHGNTVYFLVAISEFDAFNNAQSSPEKIEIAIRSLLRIYDKVGQGYDMYIPLIGTGRSRAGLSSWDAYTLLTNCIINNSNLIHGHIYLVLQPEDRDEIEKGK